MKMYIMKKNKKMYNNIYYDIIGYCRYCGRAILRTDVYIVSENMLYHPNCFRQMNTYYDPYEEIELPDRINEGG